MCRRRTRYALALTTLLFVASRGAYAVEPRPPIICAAQAGSLIVGVTIQTHGVTAASVVRQYLTMRPGSVLTQRGVDRDYDNLVHVAGYRASLSVQRGERPKTVDLHWDVIAKPLLPTAHPYYNDRPLTAPFPGIGFVLASPPIDPRGSHFSASTQLGQFVNLFSVFHTAPLSVNANKGTESDLISGFSGGRGVYQQNNPPNSNIYSWTNDYHVDYWLHNANDTQFELGVHEVNATTRFPSGIASPYIYQTWRSPARNTLLEAGLLHGCVNGERWYPPYCSFQYRVQIADALGGFGSTSKYEAFTGGAAGYIRAGKSVVAAQLTISRTGGVLPESFLVCSGARAYPRAFCGTDAQLLQLEYRIDDTLPKKLKFVLFFEDAASRVRGQTLPVDTSRFQWDADGGAGVIYRNTVRIDFAYGRHGLRTTFAIQGQTF